MKPRSTPLASPSDRIKEILAQVQELNSSSLASTNKHQQIRVSHWMRKLLSQPTSNPAWLKNVGEHSAVLLQMLQDGVRERAFFAAMLIERDLSTLNFFRFLKNRSQSCLLRARSRFSLVTKCDTGAATYLDALSTFANIVLRNMASGGTPSYQGEANARTATAASYIPAPKQSVLDPRGLAR